MTSGSEPWDDDPDVAAWLRRANEELRPMIKGSAHTMALISGEEPDAKQAVELGFMILLDKPIILAVIPGVAVPVRLARAADEIVEVDMDDTVKAAASLTAAIGRIEERLHSETHERKSDES
jgi:hypothetical protein